MPTPIQSTTIKANGSLEIWPPTESGKRPMNGRDLPAVLPRDLTDEERDLAAKYTEMCGIVYDRLAAVANDASLAAAYDAHPEVGAVVQALTLANARLVELGEEPIEISDEAKAVAAKFGAADEKSE